MLKHIMSIFFKHSKTANSVVHEQIWSKFELIPDMVVFVIAKNNGDLIKNVHYENTPMQYTEILKFVKNDNF